jgi:hypothetical protein
MDDAGVCDDDIQSAEMALANSTAARASSGMLALVVQGCARPPGAAPLS